MKRIISFLVLSFALLQMSAQSVPVVCSVGFAFEISNNPNWGRGEPGVMFIITGSPLPQFGLLLIGVEVNL